MIETAEQAEIERHLIGERGCWIEPTDNDRFAVFDQNGTLHGYIRGKDAAERACLELSTTGKITR